MATQTVDLSAEIVNLKRSVMCDLLGLAVYPDPKDHCIARIL